MMAFTGVVAEPPKGYVFSQDSTTDAYYIKFDDGLERGDLNLDDVSSSQQGLFFGTFL